MAGQLRIDMELDWSEVERLVRDMPRQMEAALNDIVDDLLEVTELAQIQSYLSDSMPARPPGSDYERTFELRDSSRTERPDTTLPNISGLWYATADYAEDVLGPRRKQKRIHRRRWKSLEDVEAEVLRLAPQIADDRLREIRT